MRKNRRGYPYQISLIPEREGGFAVIVPLLPGCVSYGKTVEEESRNAREAVELPLEKVTAHSSAIP